MDLLQVFTVNIKKAFVSINLFFFISVARLGYTYLRLKDNHMEILNKDDEIERLVVPAPQRATHRAQTPAAQRDGSWCLSVFTQKYGSWF